jgi:hypothetical protein
MSACGRVSLCLYAVCETHTFVACSTPVSSSAHLTSLLPLLARSCEYSFLLRDVGHGGKDSVRESLPRLNQLANSYLPPVSAYKPWIASFRGWRVIDQFLDRRL